MGGLEVEVEVAVEVVAESELEVDVEREAEKEASILSRSNSGAANGDTASGDARTVSSSSWARFEMRGWWSVARRKAWIVDTVWRGKETGQVRSGRVGLGFGVMW